MTYLIKIYRFYLRHHDICAGFVVCAGCVSCRGIQGDVSVGVADKQQATGTSILM